MQLTGCQNPVTNGLLFCSFMTGLRDAKMKVLEQIQNVMVRDIPKFVDWLKTVRVEYHGDRGNRKYHPLW